MNHEQLSIILEEMKIQNEWQRHNENQRALLVNILWLIAAGVILFLPQNLSSINIEIPIFLIGIGVFGILAIFKYWERFMYHTTIDEAFQKVLDNYFLEQDKKNSVDSIGLYLQTKYTAIQNHEKNFLIFRDKHFMQHWLWVGVFVFIIIIGSILLLKSLHII